MLNPGDAVGPYTVRRYLGSSSVGAGYEVEHVDLGTTHTLNLLPVANARVPVELSDQLGLTHPNILGVTALLHIGGHMGVLTEFFAGRPLGDLLANQELDLEQRLEVLHEILQGVGAAHLAGVLHLDLRPGNILVGGSHNAPVIKVAFFRLARIMREMDEHSAIATTRFAAPELMMPGMSAEPAADIFSIGAILYEMVAGKPAFSGNAPGSIRAKTIGRFEPLLEANPDAPPEIASVVDKALQPRPFDRFVTVEELGRAVFGDSFQIFPAERREVHEGTARPVTRSTGAPPDRQATPPIPEGPPEEAEAPVPLVAIFGVVGLIAVGILGVAGVAAVGSSVVGPAASSVADQALPAIEAAENSARLADDVIALGGDAGRIKPLARAFGTASASRKIYAGYRLHQTLVDELDAMPVSPNDADQTSRRRVELELEQAGAPLQQYVDSVDDWVTAAGSFTGSFAITMGLASGPPSDTVKLLSIEP